MLGQRGTFHAHKHEVGWPRYTFHLAVLRRRKAAEPTAATSKLFPAPNWNLA